MTPEYHEQDGCHNCAHRLLLTGSSGYIWVCARDNPLGQCNTEPTSPKHERRLWGICQQHKKAVQ
jgi:hypothetical protein